MPAGSDRLLERLKALHPKLIDLTLERVERLLAALGNPENRLPPVVHIAGTKGKGSTLAMLRAILEAAGQRVHAYTSPHLVRFHERVRLAGRLIDEDRLAALLDEVERANAGQPITFFEVTTAAAFLAFAREPADWLLLEVGMGGRLDATNMVARPALTVIAPVGLDHQGFLGDTLAAIAAEKAGILKPGVPLVAGLQPPEAAAVIAARAKALGVPVAWQGRDFTIAEGGKGLVYRDGDAAIPLPRPALIGPHQVENAGLAVAAARRLPGFRPTPAQLAAGLAGAQWPARMQRLSTGALAARLPVGWELWLDGGHNPMAGTVIAAAVAPWHDRPLDLVVGMLNSKDAGGFLAALAPCARRALTVTIPGEPNAIPAAALAATARAAGLDAAPADGVAAALATLAQGAGPARVLVTGSLYLAGTVLRENGTPVT